MNNIYRTPVTVPDLPDDISLAQQYRNRAISLLPPDHIVPPYKEVLKAKKQLPSLMKRALKLISKAANLSLLKYTIWSWDMPWLTTWNKVAADLLAEQLHELGFITRVWVASSGNVYLDVEW